MDTYDPAGISAELTSEWKADLEEQERRTQEQLPAPGPVWTNGVAPAAADTHPAWCDRFHARRSPTGLTVHSLEILSTTATDESLAEDVPLRVSVQRVDSVDDGPGAVHTLVEIGHAMFQPVGVILDQSTRAQLIAALLTAHGLENLS